jgi:membrane fusion protein (multidrug efflux system)
MESLPRRLVTIAVVLAVAAALAWVYVSRRPDAGPGAGPPGMRGAPAMAAQGGRGGPGGQMPPVAVVTTAVETVPLAVEIDALGTLRANEAVEITAKVGNQVTAVRFTEGQRVAAGQVLVELDGAQARADLAAAEAALTESRSAYSRSRDLFTRQALSESQLEQIEATLKGNEARVASARARVADTVIRAPFAGRVGLRRVSVGTLVSPGDAITTLDDTSVMKLDFDVPETFLAMLESGLAVSALSAAYPQRTFQGTVRTVDSRVDPVSRSVTVRAELDNAAGLLKPGMFMTVRLAREAAPALVVPEAAIVPERGKVYVFVVEGGKVERREVATGRREPGRVELLAGAVAGERVVVEGTQKVRDGSAVVEAGEAGPVRPAAAPAPAEKRS